MSSTYAPDFYAKPLTAPSLDVLPSELIHYLCDLTTGTLPGSEVYFTKPTQLCSGTAQSINKALFWNSTIN